MVEKSQEVIVDAIALYPGVTAEEKWYVLSIESRMVVKRSNFEVCSKYSERAIKFLSELALEDYNMSAAVERG